MPRHSANSAPVAAIRQGKPTLLTIINASRLHRNIARQGASSRAAGPARVEGMEPRRLLAANASIEFDGSTITATGTDAFAATGALVVAGTLAAVETGSDTFSARPPMRSQMFVFFP